jgi:hypothetical protein
MLQIYLIAALVGAAALFGVGYAKGSASVRADWDKERAVLTAAALDAERKAREEERAKAVKAQEVANAYRQQANKAKASAAAAGSELDRLRNAIADGSGSAACHADATGRPDGADTARELVGACAVELSIMAAAADIAEARVSALQAWIREVAR